MAWAIDPAELVAARVRAAADAEEFAGASAFQRLGRAQLWLDEAQEARRSFREAAERVRTDVIETGRAEQSSTWAQYGHLLRRAGAGDAARAAYARALELADERRDAARSAELRYLLWQAPGDGGDGLFPGLLRALASREPGAIGDARAAIVRALRADRATPDYTAPDLTLYDLLEETFRVEAELTGEPLPPYRTMLERSGLLRAGPPPPPPAIDPPPVGRWTLGEAALERPEQGPIVITIDAGLRLELIQSSGEYEVRTWRGQEQVGVTGMHPTFGEALDAAADALRAQAGAPAVATLTALLAECAQPQ